MGRITGSDRLHCESARELWWHVSLQRAVFRVFTHICGGEVVCVYWCCTDEISSNLWPRSENPGIFYYTPPSPPPSHHPINNSIASILGTDMDPRFRATQSTQEWHVLVLHLSDRRNTHWYEEENLFLLFSFPISSPSNVGIAIEGPAVALSLGPFGPW